jgi:hypothetical protein
LGGNRQDLPGVNVKKLRLLPKFRRKIGPVGGRDNSLLNAGQSAQERTPSLRIQFTHDIVQQEERRRASDACTDLQFGQFERQGRGALLAATTKGA